MDDEPYSYSESFEYSSLFEPTDEPSTIIQDPEVVINLLHIHCTWQTRFVLIIFDLRGLCGHDRRLVGFITTYAMGAYHH